MTTTPVLVVNASYTVDPGDISAFTEISRTLAQAARASSGCVYFHVAQDVEQNSKFHLLEGWTSQASVEAFSQSELFRELLGKAMSLRILDRRGLQLNVSHAEPLAMPG